MFNAEIGWFTLLGGAALWPIRRLMVRSRMERLTPEWNEWAVIQAELTLEGFITFGIFALFGALFDRVVPRWSLGFDPMASTGLHILAAASAAVAIEAVRHPGFVTRLAMVLLGAAWLVASALAALSAYKPTPPSDLTGALPIVMLLGLGAYGFSWWRGLRRIAEPEAE